MKPPVILLDNDQEMPLTAAPVEALRAFVAGTFDTAHASPTDNPLLTKAIAARLLAEKERAQ